ncbi:hypothetical protein EPN83_00790 [Patescibacteria group bacterium]|nr:MAG: hypothetical protein EPN83_00790 [Patescibacteria group bacterium]
MDTLSKLFGGTAKVKLLKLFVFNPGAIYDISDLARRTKENPRSVRRELPALRRVGLIKRKSFYKTVLVKRRRRRLSKKVRTPGWIFNDHFKPRVPLQTFLITMSHLEPKEIARKLQRGGAVKLIIIAGTFIQDPESRVDLLVVGDHIRRGVIESAIKSIEAEMGRELRYTIFDTSEFRYRLAMYDKLVRDILDYPHEKILNKIGIL